MTVGGVQGEFLVADILLTELDFTYDPSVCPSVRLSVRPPVDSLA